MAEKLSDITFDHDAPFSPRPYYSASADSLFYYFENARYYGDRLDEILTVCRAIDNDRIVGFQLKGISQLVGRLHTAHYDFAGDVKLSFIFTEAVGDQPARPHICDLLRQRIEGVEIPGRELSSAIE